jgi:alpha-galactosidase
MREKVVLIGAGSAMFTRGLLRDMIERQWDAEVALVDVDARALATAAGLARKMIIARRAPLTLSSSTDRREVLPGASVVITTIGVGSRRAWEQDVFVPRKHGIFQPVGDTVMPGGTSRALRMIPPMVEIAEDILDLAPQALFFNYGNPMAAVCRAVHKATGANMVGLCHGVRQVHAYLARALGVPIDRVTFSAAGINHLTWFTEVRVDGRDAMPQLKRVAGERLAGGVLPKHGDPRMSDTPWDESGVSVDYPFAWQMLELFGAFPCVMDRHITEFFPHLFCGEQSYYGRTLGVDAFPFEAVIELGDKVYREMEEHAVSTGPLPADYFDRISGEHEQVVEIIEDIRRDGGRTYSANLPNRGQVPHLPPEAIVECPVVAQSEGLRPILLSTFDSALAGTLATRFQWVETVVDAALQGSRQKFVQALLLDGAVPSIDAAQRLAGDLLEAQAEYLPRFCSAAKACTVK